MATGVSQAMRSDPRLMQELAASTRLGPDQRVQALTRFNDALFTNEKVRWKRKRRRMMTVTVIKGGNVRNKKEGEGQM